MRVKFFASDKQRERDLAAAFTAGVITSGDTASVEALSAMPSLKNIDVACMVGVKSKRLFDRCIAAGVVPILLDKGYSRHRREGGRVWEFWRVSVGSHHPTRFLAEDRLSKKRAETMELDIRNWRKHGFQIVIAGSSAKYHEFYGLPDPTTWAAGVAAEIRRHTDKPIIYRPKPSWKEAVPIEGAYFSDGTENIGDTMRNAWALVTHGSNACFEAALAGIPSIVLGDGVAAPISSRSLKHINAPELGERGQWLGNLMYWQWTEREMQRGAAWNFLREYVGK